LLVMFKYIDIRIGCIKTGLQALLPAELYKRE
jgi:hypothetical protein